MNPDVLDFILANDPLGCLHPSTSINNTNIMSQAMTSSFSMDVSAYSSDLYEYPAANRPASGLCNAFVLCWENVLVPTKWMRQQLGLRPSVQALHAAKQRVLRSPNLQAALATVEQHLIQLLTSVSSYGPLFIVSEESVHFVEAMCKTLFPRLAFCLASSTTMTSVQVLGAPSRFQSAAEKAAWRVNLLQSVCRDRLFGGAPQRLFDPRAGKFGLVVVSPHQSDIAACGDVYQAAPYAVAKSVHVQNARNLPLEEFTLHLQTLAEYVPQAAPCDTSFAIQL
ncbi:Protein unc-50 [Phytophthora pseudosyringae]|uniref:Protein unc-50 n=1 Tax=Phytophthora pseudosyringae TaxID=221518 RepID=A0A8T1VZL7_9STRA|nr:Protein unc-50 [Phytophthora pseudosyringae]